MVVVRGLGYAIRILDKSEHSAVAKASFAYVTPCFYDARALHSDATGHVDTLTIMTQISPLPMMRTESSLGRKRSAEKSQNQRLLLSLKHLGAEAFRFVSRGDPTLPVPAKAERSQAKFSYVRRLS